MKMSEMTCHRADTAWMRSNFGISVHWVSQSVLQDGTNLPYEEAVNRFDPEKFADTLAAAGAEHCIFTLTHACEYLAMPNPFLEKLLPGRTTGRDLIGELIRALKERGIRFIAYYNHSCNGNDDPVWKKACGYADGIHGNLDGFAENICNIVGWISRRYGSDIDGWWFDSSYSVDPHGPHNSVSCEIGSWQFPWEKLAAAAKSGNPESAVAFNAGIGSCFLYTDCQDYYCGETVALDQVFTPEPRPDIQDHRWICADSGAWVFDAGAAVSGFAEPQFPDERLKEFIARHLNDGRMVTLNVQIDQGGVMNPKAIAQIQRIR